jgi:hypothetical protein
VLSEAPTLTLTADSSGIVSEPCDANNMLAATLDFSGTADLAMSSFALNPPHADHRTERITMIATVTNLGSLGTTDDQIVVNFWDGDPDREGVLLHTETIRPGEGQHEAVVDFAWLDLRPGPHQIVAEIVPPSDDSDLTNNRLSQQIILPRGDRIRIFPLMLYQSAARDSSGSQASPDLTLEKWRDWVADWKD